MKCAIKMINKEIYEKYLTWKSQPCGRVAILASIHFAKFKTWLIKMLPMAVNKRTSGGGNHC